MLTPLACIYALVLAVWSFLQFCPPWYVITRQYAPKTAWWVMWPWWMSAAVSEAMYWMRMDLLVMVITEHMIMTIILLLFCNIQEGCRILTSFVTELARGLWGELVPFPLPSPWKENLMSCSCAHWYRAPPPPPPWSPISKWRLVIHYVLHTWMILIHTCW